MPSPKLEVDGVFGPLTNQAVLQYQKGVSIVVDGVVGKLTWYRLLKGDQVSVPLAFVPVTQTAARGPGSAPKSPPAFQKPQILTPPAVTAGIWEWPLEDKFAEALRRTGPKLPGSMRHEFEALVSPTNLGIIAGTLVIWAGSHAFGVGQIVDIALLVGGAVFLGIAVVDVVEDLGSFLAVTVNATNEEELDDAATHLARAIVVIGVVAFIALVAKVAKGRGGKGAIEEVPPEPAPAKNRLVPKAGPSEPPAVLKTGTTAKKFDYDLTPGRDVGQPIKFGQPSVNPNFSHDGKFSGASIDELAAKLKSGELSPDEFPVRYIWVNGEKTVVNNRSLTTLSKAGMKPTKTIDMTGKLPKEGDDSLPSVLQRLNEMGGKPSDTMPVRTAKDWSSPIRETVSLPE
jgi:peptidoglycan hydrolase-like protein with peptidoglycan-binding domain